MEVKNDVADKLAAMLYTVCAFPCLKMVFKCWRAAGKKSLEYSLATSCTAVGKTKFARSDAVTYGTIFKLPLECEPCPLHAAALLAARAGKGSDGGGIARFGSICGSRLTDGATSTDCCVK